MSKKLQRAQRFGVSLVTPGQTSYSPCATIGDMIRDRPAHEILDMTVIELMSTLSLTRESEDAILDRPLPSANGQAETHDHCTCDYDTCICPRLKQLTPQEKAAMKAKLDIELDFIAMGVADFNPHTPEGVGFLRRGWKPLMFEA